MRYVLTDDWQPLWTLTVLVPQAGRLTVYDENARIVYNEKVKRSTVELHLEEGFHEVQFLWRRRRALCLSTNHQGTVRIICTPDRVYTP